MLEAERIKEHRRLIKAELQNCRSLYEVYRINIGLKQVYPHWLVDQERCRRVLEFTVDKILKNRKEIEK